MMWPPEITALFRTLLRSVQNLTNAIQEKSRATTQAGEASQEQDNPPPKVLAEVSFPEAIEKAKTERQDKSYRLSKVQVILTGATFAVVAAYTGVAACQLSEMRKTTKAAQDAVKAAQNANELSRAFFGTFGVTPQPQLGRIAIDLGNSGRAIAIISSVTADLTIQRLRDNSIFQQGHREWKGPIPVQSGFGKWFDINGMWPTDPSKREQAIWQELWQDTITVSIQVSYDSGFGKIERQSFCQTLVADERINGPGKAPGMTNQTCEDAAPFIEVRKKQLGLATQNK